MLSIKHSSKSRGASRRRRQLLLREAVQYGESTDTPSHSPNAACSQRNFSSCLQIDFRKEGTQFNSISLLNHNKQTIEKSNQIESIYQSIINIHQVLIGD